MASSGSFSGSIRDGHYKLRVDWSQSKNVSANTSTVTCKLYLVNDWSLNISGRSDNTCTIDGSAQTFSSPAISTTGTHLLGTVSRTVNHASDGSKSLAISAVFQIRATLSGTYYGTITASANITLDSIPRASSVSAANMTMGSAGTISISRASSAFTHTLTYSFGNTSGTIATKTTATSVSWTPALSLASQIPNATSGTCTITCTTYNGNTNIGSKTCTLTLSVPASVKPTISSLTASRIDGEVPSTFGFELATVVVNDSVTREAITRKQMRQFLKFVHDDNVYCKYYEVVYILFHTGMRISEFCGLTLKDLDMKNRIINIGHQLQRTSDMRLVIESTKTNAGTRKLPMSEDVFRCFQAIIEDREEPRYERVVDGYTGFLFTDKEGLPLVAMHWEHRFNHMVKRYNDIYRVQMPNITPHVCRHTYCSNMAKSGMNPKTLQYLMGHSDIGVTLNTYTHLGLEDAVDELKRVEELENARKEMEKLNGEGAISQKMFRVV